jgi:hypothetical protein
LRVTGLVLVLIPGRQLHAGYVNGAEYQHAVPSAP